MGFLSPQKQSCLLGIVSGCLLSFQCVAQTEVLPAQAGYSAPVYEAEDEDDGVNRNLLELLNQQQRLTEEIRQMRGDLETVINDIEGLKRRQRELYLDVDRRLREVELRSVGGVSSTKPKTRPSVEAPVVPTPQVPLVENQSQMEPPMSASKAIGAATTEPSSAEQSTYRAAFDLLKEGLYGDAILAFQDFLLKYPKGSYSDNAQYWLGEANYVSRNYRQALAEFNRVIAVFPSSTKVPDAMLKSGYTFYELNEWAKAKAMLKSLQQKYPKSTASQLADTRLQRMAKEGH